MDELFDLDSEDATNLIGDPGLAGVRKEMIRELGAAPSSDPRWLGYGIPDRALRRSAPRTRRHAAVRSDMQLFEAGR